ncbi:MAG: PadR family transcriptional regulator [Acidobacteriota bacterium]
MTLKTPQTTSDNDKAGRTPDALEQQLVLELRRGLITLTVLGALRQPAYGYSLRQHLAENGFEVDQGTLYPLLRRLDGQGLLDSDWNTEGARPRKYYRLNARGSAMLETLRGHWHAMAEVVETLFASSDSEEGDTP